MVVGLRDDVRVNCLFSTIILWTIRILNLSLPWIIDFIAQQKVNCYLDHQSVMLAADE